MNWLVITIGTALVMALTAAVIGPHFIDWTVYRATIEAHAERVLGTPVAIDGPAEVRLLPRPRLVLDDVRLGATERPLLEADRVEIDVDLMPLLRGEVRITTLAVEAPTAYARIEADGALSVPDVAGGRRSEWLSDAGGVAVESVTARGGTLVIIDGRDVSRSRIEGIDITGRAGSLRGPFRIDGTARFAGVPTAFQIAGGLLEGAKMPVSVRAEPAGGGTLTFDGSLVPTPRAVSLAGRLEVVANASAPVAIRGTLAASTGRVTLSDAIVSYGKGDATLTLAGRANLPLASADPLSVALEARQIDFDRLDHALAGIDLPDGAIAPPATPAAAPPAEAMQRLLAYLAPLAGLAAPAAGLPEATLTLDVGTVLSGGSVVRDVSLAARATLNGIVVDRAEALLPGDASVRIDGRIAVGFAGTVEATAAQPATLLAWWTGNRPADPIDPVVLDADVEVGEAGVSARRLSVRFGKTAVAGRARWSATPSPALDLALSAPLLEAEDAIRLARLVRTLKGRADGLDLALDLAVDRVTLGAVDGERLTVKGGYRDGTLTLAALAADDLAGARLFASGSIANLTGVPVGRIEGTLVAAAGAELGAAAAALLPGGRAERLTAVLPALAPADLRFALTGRPSERAPDLGLTVAGTIGGLDLSVTASGAPVADGWKHRPLTLRLEASGPAPGLLLAALGLGGVAEPSATGRLSVAMAGVPSDGLDTFAEAAAGDLSARYEGSVSLGDRLAFSGRAHLAAARTAPLAGAAGVALPEAGPVDLSAHLSRAGEVVALNRIEGTVAGRRIDGALTATADRIGGRLRTDALALDPLLALVLGDGALAAPADGAVWPVTAFGPPVALPLAVGVAIEAGELSLGDFAATDATLEVAAETGRLSITGFDAALRGGRLAGSASLSRDGPGASLAADFALDAVPLGENVWSVAGEPVATGTARLSARLAGSGVTVAGLAAGITGSGELAVSDVRIAVDLSPLAVPSLADVATPGEADVRSAVLDEFAGETAVDTLAVPVDVAAGTARIEDVAVGGATVGASLDVGTGALAGDVVLVVEPSWTGGQSAVTVAFTGPLAAPERTVDVAQLTAWLSLRQLERQVESVEAQNEALAAEAAGEEPPARPAESEGPPPFRMRESVPGLPRGAAERVPSPPEDRGAQLAPAPPADGAAADTSGTGKDADGSGVAHFGSDGRGADGGIFPLSPRADAGSRAPTREHTATVTLPSGPDRRYANGTVGASDPIAAIIGETLRPDPGPPAAVPQ